MSEKGNAVESPETLRSQAEDLLTQEGSLSAEERVLCAALQGKLTAQGGELYADKKTQALAVELFTLARRLRNLTDHKKEWGRRVNVVSQLRFGEPIVDLTRSPWGISSLVAAKLMTTLGGEVVKVTDGVRVGLKVVNEEDERAAQIRKVQMTDLDLENNPPRKLAARKRRAADLIAAMDATASEIVGYDETSRVAFTEDRRGSVVADDVVVVGLHDVGKEFFFDGTEKDIEALWSKREEIWTMVSSMDEGQYRPVQVGSVRDGGRKHR